MDQRTEQPDIDDYDALSREYARACEELERARRDMSLLAIAAEQRVKETAAYRLGHSILQNRHPLNWPKLPLAIWRLYKYRNKKNRSEIFEKEFKNVSCSPALRAVIEHHQDQSRTLRIATEIARELGYEHALVFVEKHATDSQRNALNALRANQHLADEQAWLKWLNAYTRPYGIAPFQLSDSPGPRFLRLVSTPPRAIHDGPLVSVIMPAFNAQATIVHAAQSILAQTWKNLELFIVDDCSTDETWKIIQDLAKTDARVIPLKNAVNVGPYVSKNLVLRIARGQYVTGQDADDWSHPERLEKDLATLQENPQIKAVLSGMLRMNASGELSNFARTGTTSHDGVSRISSISLLIETAFLKERLGGWDSVRFGADSELIGRLEIVAKSHFRRLNHLGMICLDIETSLTNNPIHGVSKITGISPVRQMFRDAYLAWHAQIDEETAHLPFPHVDRKFAAPDAMLVPVDSIQTNLQAHQAQLQAASR